ncbi:unnamed protein product [Colias eurytheme]|nr:unnamed protein product [Colias eurytheme]
MFVAKPNNSRLVPYQRNIPKRNVLVEINNATLAPEPSDWKPIIMFKFENQKNRSNKTESKLKKVLNKKRKRPKRSLENFQLETTTTQSYSEPRAKKQKKPEFLDTLLYQARDYIKSFLKSTLKYKEEPPAYYTVTYNLVVYILDIIEGFVEVNEDLFRFFSERY